MVIIRNACEKDVQGFVDYYLKVWRSFRGILPEQMIQDVIEEAGQPSFQENIWSAIANPDRILLVAEKDEEIVGHTQGRANKRGYSWLGFMGVSPDRRRRGIGRALLRGFIEESRKSSCTKRCTYSSSSFDDLSLKNQ